MWHLKTVLVVVVAVAALLLGSSITHGFWWWNARIDVEGQHIRTMWGVEAPGIKSYFAEITVSLPEEADARIIKKAPNEEVELEEDDDLRCLENSIEAVVEYEVEAINDNEQGTVVVSVETRSGEVLGRSSGNVGEEIEVEVLIPGSCSG